jgi:hypothetical protein
VSGFVASSSPSASPAPDPADQVDGGEFFMPLSIAEFRDSMRVSATPSQIRVRDALRSGILTVRVELRAWAAAQVAAGFPSIDAVDAPEVDFESVLVLLYRRAAFSFAAAELVETHSDISATKDGKDRIVDQVLTADEHRRNGIHAIRDILGAPRTTVELI